MTGQKLSKPPIIEALAQINYQTTNGELPDFNAWAADLKPSLQEDIFQVQIPPVGEMVRNIIGKRFVSSDQKLSVQITNEFIAVSKFGGYEDWSDFSSEFERQFNRLFSTTPVSNISRLALRYINQFDFDIADSPNMFLTNLAPIRLGAPFQPQVTNASVVMAVPHIQGEAVIQQSLEARVAVSKWVATLDIDVFINRSVKADMNAIKNEFILLRDVKNQAFNALITEKCRDGFV